MAKDPIDTQLLQTLARVRKLLNEGYTLNKISNLTGWTKHRIWKVKHNYRGYHSKTSLPINSLELQRPSRPGILCRKCGEPARIFVKSKICLQCEIFEMSKLGLVVILDPNREENG